MRTRRDEVDCNAYGYDEFSDDLYLLVYVRLSLYTFKLASQTHKKIDRISG